MCVKPEKLRGHYTSIHCLCQMYNIKFFHNYTPLVFNIHSRITKIPQHREELYLCHSVFIILIALSRLSLTSKQ